MPREMGKVRAATQAPVVVGPGAAVRGGGDERSDGIAGRDRGEPRAQADVLVQRRQGCAGWPARADRASAAAASTASSHVWRAPPRVTAAGDDGARGQDEDHAGPGPGVGQDRGHRGGPGRPLQRGLADSARVTGPAEQHRGDEQRDGDGDQGADPADGQPGARGPGGEQGEEDHDRVEQACRSRPWHWPARAPRRPRPSGWPPRLPPGRSPPARTPAPGGTPTWRHRSRTSPGAASARTARTAPRRRTRPGARTAGVSHPTAAPSPRA